MSDLVVRRLLVDLEAPIARHWCGGDAFRTAFMGALSMSFPVGEQFFIDAVRDGFAALPQDRKAQHADTVRGFVGQEATHRRLHDLFNAHLARAGLVNGWGPRARRRQRLLDGADVRHRLAITAAYEHFTAILADWMLRRPHLLGTDDERIARLWLWHAAEESEHRSVAFDLYRELGGNERWRRRWFRRATVMFLLDASWQTLDNLRRDGTLWHRGTWSAGLHFLFGPDGLVRGLRGRWGEYRRPDFHPGDQDVQPARDWLDAHREAWAPVAGRTDG